jgi:hypothetical protein
MATTITAQQANFKRAQKNDKKQNNGQETDLSLLLQPAQKSCFIYKAHLS